MVTSSDELFFALHRLRLADDRFPFWWRNYGNWWVIIEAILTQQTKWENVEKSVQNLKSLGYDSLQNIANAEAWKVAQAITPAGFYNQKTARIISLTQNLIRDFGDFETFADEASREWLLDQKGIGLESADSILCYGCKQDVMVVDNYTHKLLVALDIEIDDYHEIQEWLIGGIESNFDKIERELNIDLNAAYCYFHGMIVEFGKKHTHKRVIDISVLS